MTQNTKYPHKRTHTWLIHTASETLTLAAFSWSETRMELPARSSESQAAIDSAGRAACAIQASNKPCLVGQGRGPALLKSLRSLPRDSQRCSSAFDQQVAIISIFYLCCNRKVTISASRNTSNHCDLLITDYETVCIIRSKIYLKNVHVWENIERVHSVLFAGDDSQVCMSLVHLFVQYLFWEIDTFLWAMLLFSTRLPQGWMVKYLAYLYVELLPLLFVCLLLPSSVL